MSFILKGLMRGFKFVPRLVPIVGKYGGLGFAGLWVTTQFIIECFTKGIPYAFAHAGRTIFAAELTINQNVHLAIMDAPEYGLTAFIAIVVGVLIMYSVVKWVGKGVRYLTGANFSFGEIIVGLFVLAMMSIVSTKIIDGTFGFVPIRDSLVFLFVNIQAVIGNVF